MKKILSIVFCIAVLTGLVGCTNNEISSQNLMEHLIEEGIPQTSISETEKEKYNEIYIHDKDIGYASIYVYKDKKDAQNYWDNLEDRYDNLEFLDETTAVGDLKDVCDASIEEWIYFKDNVIVSVQQYVANEWGTYVAEDGEEYYGDGTKVSDVPTPDEQRNRAAKLEALIVNCLK